MEPWIVLDRDGVINVDQVDYIKSVAEWQSIPGSIEAIARLSSAGYKVAIATNQSGIGKGIYDLACLEAIHNKLESLVEQRGGSIAGIFYCPHHPDDGCACRKPAVGLLDEIERQFSISLKGIPFVGDAERDIEAALSKGCQPILVRTGKGTATCQTLIAQHRLNNIPVYDDLASYVHHLLS